MKCKLKDIVNVTMGQSPKSEFYNTTGEGVPFLQGNRTFGLKYPTFDTFTTKVTKMANAGDVIMSVRAPVGDLNITPSDVCLGRGVCSLRMKNENQEFLYYMMKYYVPKLVNMESGTVFGSVNKNDINELKIDIPADENQQLKISKILSIIDEKIKINNDINKWFRYRAAAIIIEEGYVLFAGNEIDDYYYSIGGGVHMGETSEQAVKREVLEETGVPYEIDRLAVIHENFFDENQGTLKGMDCHEVSMYYLMKPRGTRKINSNSYTQGVREKMHWIPLEDLDKYKAFPTFLKEYLSVEHTGIEHIVTDERK